MIDNRFIERLLDGCDVEWKTLDEISNFRRGSFPQPYGKSEWYDGNGAMPFVQVADVNENMSLVEDTKRKISIKAQSKSIFVEKGTVIVTLQGSIGRVAITQYDSYIDRTISIFESYNIVINKKYFAYQLQAKFAVEKKNVRGSTIKTITKEEFRKFLIPIPCPDNPEKSLKIQTEIVRILDSFTKLTAELTTELTTELIARNNQYSYYRDQLFEFKEGDVEYKKLEDIGEILRGNGMQKKDFVEEGFPAIHYGQIYTKYGLQASNTYTFVSEVLAKKLKIAKKNDLLIATTSENDEDLLKPIAWLGEKTAISGDMMLFKHNEDVKFLAHYFQTSAFQNQKKKYITGAKVRRISKDNLYKMTVPIPYPNSREKSLAEQKRIVSILDKFETLTRSITEGLPREIELRNKQYEYYRDMLLDFPKDEVGV